MKRESKFKCSLCFKETIGYGHNPEPLKEFSKRCCDSCNEQHVIPARLSQAMYMMNVRKGAAS